MFLVISTLKIWVTQKDKFTRVELSLNISCCLFFKLKFRGPVKWNVDMTQKFRKKTGI